MMLKIALSVAGLAALSVAGLALLTAAVTALDDPQSCLRRAR